MMWATFRGSIPRRVWIGGAPRARPRRPPAARFWHSEESPSAYREAASGRRHVSLLFHRPPGGWSVRAWSLPLLSPTLFVRRYAVTAPSLGAISIASPLLSRARLSPSVDSRASACARCSGMLRSGRVTRWGLVVGSKMMISGQMLRQGPCGVRTRSYRISPL